MKKYKKPVFSLLIICGLAFFAFGLSFNLAKCQAADNITTKMIGSITNITLPSAGTSQADINNKTHHIVGKAINAFISFLGIIFLALTIYGGYKWMLAKGEEEEIKKAKEIIKAAVIGLINVLMSYAITYFVVSQIQNAAK